MGVDYYTCANCHSNFPDCVYYFTCSTCEEHFCSDTCGAKEIEEDGGEDEYEDTTTCILCRLEKVSDENMIDFLLEELKISYEDAIALYQKRYREGNL